MTVVVPFTGELHPVVRDVMSEQIPDVQFCPIEGDHGYQLLLRRLWRQRKSVVIVEHDILPWPGAIPELWQCSCRWGAYSYQLHGGIGIYHGFGCAKLTGELMEIVPNIWEGELAHWSQLDQMLWFAARAKGHEPHPHRPPVIHLNPRHRERT